MRSRRAPSVLSLSAAFLLSCAAIARALPTGSAQPSRAAVAASRPPAPSAGGLWRTHPMLVGSFGGRGSAVVHADGSVRFEAVGPDGRASSITIALARPGGVSLRARRGDWSLVEDAAPPREDERRLPANGGTARGPLLRIDGAVYVERAGDRWSFLAVEEAGPRAFAYLYEPGDEPPRPPDDDPPTRASCSSGACRMGSCSIECHPPYLCSAGCVQGAPTCACVLPQVPPQIRPLP
jgi:hypothetical protein